MVRTTRTTSYRKIRKNLFSYCLLLLCTPAPFDAFAIEYTIEPEIALGLQKKPLVKAHSSMVVSAHPVATEVGHAILKQGGSAVDAAVAVQMVLNVVEPQSSGIGGGGLMLIHDPAFKEPLYFNGREVAPRKTLPDLFLNKEYQPYSFHAVLRGGTSIGVPGLLKMLFIAHQQYGKLPWAEVLKPAIKIARSGFIMTPRLHQLASKVHVTHGPIMGTPFFNPEGQVYPVGTLLKNQAFADTLKILAKEGINPFYTGSIAEKMIQAIQGTQNHPGFMEKQDLRNYHPRQGKALCFPYRTYSICSTGDTISGALTLFEILGILNHFDIRTLGKDRPETFDLIQKAMAIGFADRNLFIADDRFVPVPLTGLLAQKYLKSRAQELSQKPYLYIAEPGTLFSSIQYLATKEKELPSTTHFSILDSNGFAVSLTSSIEHYFGSGVYVEGFFLNNQMTDFNFEPSKNGQSSVNRAEPFKQPRSAMTPVFVYDKEHHLKLILGSAGGPWIIPYVLLTIINVIDFDMDIQQAIAAPHFSNLNNGAVELEAKRGLEYLEPFFQSENIPIKWKPFDSGTHAIHLIGPHQLEAAADPRREGTALGN